MVYGHWIIYTCYPVIFIPKYVKIYRKCLMKICFNEYLLSCTRNAQRKGCKSSCKVSVKFVLTNWKFELLNNIPIEFQNISLHEISPALLRFFPCIQMDRWMEWTRRVLVMIENTSAIGAWISQKLDSLWVDSQEYKYCT